VALPTAVRARGTGDGEPGRPFSWERFRRTAIQKWGPGYILILPAVVLIVVLMVYPLVQTVIFSLSTVQLPALSATFTGLANFVAIFAQAQTLQTFLLTIIWIVGTVCLRFVLGFLAALVFNARVRGTIWMRVLVILPWTVPSVVAANLWRWILQADNGLLDQTLRSWGFSGSAIDWLGNPSTALGAVIVAYSWAGFPFVMLLILAGMQGIPEERVEAARVDGASGWQVFRYITIPSLKPVLIVALILETVSAINAFDTIKIMTDGGPANATQTWGLQIYTVGFSYYNLGQASAMSVLLLLVAVVVFVIYGISSSGRARKSRES
jgi:ABC-type sugar transport system permease subunit